MSLMDTIRDDISSYAGFTPEAVPYIGVVLKRIVDESGTAALNDETALRSGLEAQGIDAIEVAKVILLTKVDGFEQLICGEGDATRADLDRFAHNAVMQSGLNRAEIARLTAAFALVTGVAYDYAEPPAHAESTFLDEVAFAVPWQLYDESLQSFGVLLDRAIQAGTPVSKLDYSSIEPLVHMGIPKAKYYMGYCMIHGNDDADTQMRGFKQLREAADAGDIQACAELGDYCYEQGTDMWTEAYAYYTGLGSLALNEKRRKQVVNILNRRTFNLLTLRMTGLLLVAMLVTTVMSLGAPVFGGHVLMGVICALLSAAVLTLGFIHHKVEPYDDVYVYPFAVFAIWTVFMVVRFVF